VAAPTTQPPSQQAQQPPPPPAAPLTPAQLIAVIIAALTAAVTVAELVTALRIVMKAVGVGVIALAAVAALALSWPHDVLEGTGPASRWAIRTNLLRRAQFFLSACQRVQQAIVAARSKNEPVMDAVRAAITAEQRFMSAHLAASKQRVSASAAVDGMASTYGNLLGWNAVIDPRCTPECRAANHKNFYADRPPAIGYPGTTHPNCRCFPSKPFRGAPVLP
jgi:hypothetical protein